MDVTKTGKWMERKRRKKNRLLAKKMGWEKKSKILTQRSSGESSLDPNQEGSKSRPLDHKYLRKGPT